MGTKGRENKDSLDWFLPLTQMSRSEANGRSGQERWGLVRKEKSWCVDPTRWGQGLTDHFPEKRNL